LRYLAAFLVGAAVAACGGGGSQSTFEVTPVNSSNIPAPAFESAADYFPVLTGSGNAVAVLLPNRTIYANASWTPGRMRWGDSIESWRIDACGWVVIDGFSPATAATFPAYPLTTIRSEWVNLDTGAVQQVACNAPYLPNVLPASGRYLMRQWGSINHERPFYWQSEFTFGTSESNECWQGDAPSTRRVIVQREAWWDGTWTRATGSLPWQGGQPVIPDVRYTWQASIARGAGFLWNWQDFATGQRGCLQQ
jgi:hypothetical protein